jgi:hypothetical protein
MKDFDPSEPSLIHDRRTNRTLAWSPDFGQSFEKYAEQTAPGVVADEGLELDGWMELDEGPETPLPCH